MNKPRIALSFLFCLLLVFPALAESPIRPGDRIAIIGNTFADQLRIHGYLEALLLQHTNGNPISIRNLGWGGDMLSARDRPTGFPSEESTLMDHRTDVIVACFGMGESFAGEPGIDEFKSQLTALITSHAGKKYNGTSEVRMVLVSPIACEDLGKLTPAREKRNRQLEGYTKAIREVASEANVPFVDVFETSRYLMNETVGPRMTNNGIHLNKFGYWAISRSLFDQLVDSKRDPGQPSWLLRIDAKTGAKDDRGVTIQAIESNDFGIRFEVKETVFPGLRPPTKQELSPPLEMTRDTLTVTSLEPGAYQLTIDGKPIVSADAKAWSEGVTIDGSPAHQAADAYRAKVNDKNQQFTYSWKALNQVHIVGERKSSPSGKELPKEVLQFNELANERDAELRSGIELKTRVWKIARVGQ